MTPLHRLALACLFPAILTADMYTGSFTVKVYDESGEPISNALVSGAGWKPAARGSVQPSVIHEHFENKTGTNGMATIQAETQSYFTWGIDKDGYYPICNMKVAFSNVVQGRLLPWNQNCDLTLHRIINPIPMFARNTGLAIPSLVLPQLGKPCGFDLMISDWTSPHGKGEVPDFVFQLTVTPSQMPQGFYDRYPGAVSNSDMVLTLTFSNVGDGIQEYLAPPYSGSLLRLPRFAPTTGYTPSVTSRYIATERHISNDMEVHDLNFFYRVRSRSDMSGVVTSAYYGKIYGSFAYSARGEIKFQYYLNPTPNDRNMEYAGTDHNLLKVPLDIENPPWP